MEKNRRSLRAVVTSIIFNTLAGTGGYSSIQIRNFSLFIQIPCTPRHVPFPVLMDAVPLRGPPLGHRRKRERYETSVVVVVAESSESRGWFETYGPIGKSTTCPNAPHPPPSASMYSRGDNVFGLLCLRPPPPPRPSAAALSLSLHPFTCANYWTCSFFFLFSKDSRFFGRIFFESKLGWDLRFYPEMEEELSRCEETFYWKVERRKDVWKERETRTRFNPICRTANLFKRTMERVEGARLHPWKITKSRGFEWRESEDHHAV